MIKVVAQLSWVDAEGWSTSRGIPVFWVDCEIDRANALVRAIIHRPHGAVTYTISAGLLDEKTDAYVSMHWTHNIPG